MRWKVKRGILPIRETMIELGDGSPDVVTPEVPRYPGLVELAMRRLCGAPEDYIGFRLKMRYPPIPTMAIFRHVLPEPRTAALMNSHSNGSAAR